jgi:hypothetical protein
VALSAKSAANVKLKTTTQSQETRRRSRSNVPWLLATSESTPALA